MNKQEYGEFHKYLAILKYEYLEFIKDSRSEVVKKHADEVLNAIDLLMKVCIIRSDTSE